MDEQIYFRGTALGQWTAAAEGLYWRFSARCEDPEPGVWRLWACFGEGDRPADETACSADNLSANSARPVDGSVPETRLLGVCFPGAGGLRLERRVSRQSWPLLPEAVVLGREAEGFRPWRGRLAGCELPDAMLRENGDGTRTLALFAPPEGPVPLAEQVSQMREAELDGRPCLLLDWPPQIP
ncbi:MAG: hypothetical protein IJK24_03180 [Oscillospiraceae bacterium]|nr:hypothetical protein [Oscillospiraceae bacterium]